MSSHPEALVLDGVPALRWGGPDGRIVVGVHGRSSGKGTPSWRGAARSSPRAATSSGDLPAHGNRRGLLHGANGHNL